MSKSISPDGLHNAIQRELTLYRDSVQKSINDAGEKNAKKLVRITRQTAPRRGNHKPFYKSIAYKARQQTATGDMEYIWYVKDPNYRLTHLLVHGHQTRDGGRTRANPFLQNALDSVLLQYEKDIKEVIENAK